METHSQELPQGATLRSRDSVYTIQRTLGQGGFGITYMATTPTWLEKPTDRIQGKFTVAIKEFFMADYCERDSSHSSQVSVPTTAGREQVEYYRTRFVKEARNVSRLSHPNIVQALEVFEANNTAYIVMEFIEGDSLGQWVKARGPLPEDEALGYIRQVAEALRYIHGKRMMHLDLKPANILRQLYVEGGMSMMGSPSSEKGRYYDEVQHPVIVSSFFIGKYEVTQGHWKAVTGSNPSYFHFKKGDNYPVESVSWYDVQEFIRRLNAKTGKHYRFPTEAEWEYACRAGTTTAFNIGDELKTSQAAIDSFLSIGRTKPVGTYSPNAWGLYDMHGNVYEWCSDWYGDYPTSSQTDPKGSPSGTARVVRGGSWNGFGKYCRSARRNYYNPAHSYYNVGFRLVLP
ncbi:MAG: SUMF1/EgtB/PvdO family nonheme iron enzyme [Mediterranea sp.]|jgi:formylglycine-generating enzyme required for sulfatase activity|nr:SUMF1/EgtB/PvdO family nonheme iron enzyme [Mediterranea sp.]